MNTQDSQAHDHTRDQTPELSDEGTRRKDAIRAVACRATSDRRRGVRFITSLAALALPLVLVAAIWSQLPQTPVVSDRGDLLANGGDSMPEDSGSIKTNATRVIATHVIAPRTQHVYQNVQFTVVQSHPVTVETISDDELLELLAQAGHPSGLIRMNGQVQVVEHARADRQILTVPESSGSPGEAGGA